MSTRRKILIPTLALALAGGAVAGGPASASAAPSNDDFGDAVPLRIGSEVQGSVNGATRQRGEPRHAESLARRSVWYRFHARRKVTVLLGTCKSNFDTVVAVYSGRRLSSLRPVDFNDDGCGSIGAGSRVSFTARRGRTYRIAVVGFSPRGRFTLSVSRVNAPPNDDFVDAARISLGSTVSGTTRNATRELHEPRHNGEEADLTVWFKLTVAVARPVELNTCGSGFDTVLAVYTGRAVDRLTEVTSNDDDCGLSSRVTFGAEAGVTYRIAVAEYGGHRSGAFRLTAASAP
jgi:hypothetical protein